MSLLRLSAFLALLLAFSFPAKSEAQIYADVTVSGGVSGTFTITLEHVKAPVTVANFVSLATGRKGWVDQTTGAIRYEPFYNGVIFHRVVAGFVSQVGSRNGLGNDGPGYKFRDEFDPTLRHSGPYVLSMANSGKHTNGSQIFITAAVTTSLDDKHSVFGRVTAGQAICDQINATPVVNERPVTSIVIQSVNVYGPSYAAFDVAPALLPSVVNAQPVLTRAGANWLLDHDRLPFSEYTIFRSANLTSWTSNLPTYAGATSPPGNVNVTALATGPQYFFRMPRGNYAASALADRAGNTFTFSNPLGGTAALNATKTAGTWTFNSGGTLTITSATYTPQPFTARLFLAFSNGFQFLLTLGHNTTTAGTYTGQTNVTGFENVSGTFTVAP